MTQIKPLGPLDLTDQVQEHHRVWLEAQAEIKAAFKKQNEAFSKITEILDASASLKKGEVVRLGTRRWLITGTNWHVNKQGVEHGGYYCRRVLKNGYHSQREFGMFVCENGRIHPPHGWA